MKNLHIVEAAVSDLSYSDDGAEKTNLRTRRPV